MRFVIVLVLLVGCGGPERRTASGRLCAPGETAWTSPRTYEAVELPRQPSCLRCASTTDILIDVAPPPPAGGITFDHPRDFRCLRRCTTDSQCDGKRCLGAWCDEPGRQPLSRSL
jgi:hypothetical protein